MLAAFLIAAGGCRCSDPEPIPPQVPPIGHFTEFDLLVRAAAQGERELVAQVARDLMGGEAATEDLPEAADASASLGAALGFLMTLAEDPGDMAEGVASAAAACGDCHAATGATPPGERPGFTHAGAGWWAAWGLVWSRQAPPPEQGDPRLASLVSGWKGPVGQGRAEDERRLARFLAGCADCHAAEP